MKDGMKTITTKRRGTFAQNQLLRKPKDFESLILSKGSPYLHNIFINTRIALINEQNNYNKSRSFQSWRQRITKKATIRKSIE